jgi:hypothetical protein
MTIQKILPFFCYHKPKPLHFITCKPVQRTYKHCSIDILIIQIFTHSDPLEEKTIHGLVLAPSLGKCSLSDDFLYGSLYISSNDLEHI